MSYGKLLSISGKMSMAFWAFWNFNYEFDYGVFVRRNLGEICNFWNWWNLVKLIFKILMKLICCSHTVKFLIASSRYIWLIGITLYQTGDLIMGDYPRWLIMCLFFFCSFAGRWPENGRLSPIWYQRNSRSRRWYEFAYQLIGSGLCT